MLGRAAFLLSAAAMLLLPAILNKPITVFLIVERTWGADLVRTWHLSSSKVTSLTQCSLFSMPQCSLDSFSSLRAVALCGLRLVTAYDISVLVLEPLTTIRSIRHTCAI